MANSEQARLLLKKEFNFTDKELDFYKPCGMAANIFERNMKRNLKAKKQSGDKLYLMRALVRAWKQQLNSDKFTPEMRKAFEIALTMQAQSEWGMDGDLEINYTDQFIKLTHPKKEMEII